MPTPFRWQSGERRSYGVVYPKYELRSRTFSLALLATVLLLIPFLASCGAVGSATAAPAVTVTVSPTSAQPFQDETVQFQAAVLNAGSSAVQWQVNQVAGGNSSVGTIDASGLYTAPALVPNPATVTVSAVLQSDTTKTGSSSVTIHSLSSITGTLALSPTLSSVTTSQSVQFEILTPGVTPADLTWSATGGTISAGGLFSPPTTPGPYTILAKLTANPNTAGSATVEVTDFPGTLTWRNDNARSGVNDRELALAPATVNSSSFGLLFKCSVDGFIYAQPLYVPNLTIAGKGVHNAVIVATDHNSVYAFDADSSPCVQLWQTSLGNGSPPISLPTLQITGTDMPFVGITGTPVIDAASKRLYAVAATMGFDGLTFTYTNSLYSLDITAIQSAVQPPGVQIVSPQPASPGFSSFGQMQSSALLLESGNIYAGFGSIGGMCAGEPNPCLYRGWLFAHDLNAHPTGAFDATPGPLGDGGLGAGGSGPSADSSGNIFVTTGDGPFGPSVNGTNYSDSILHLTNGSSTGLSLLDFFTPCEQTIAETGAEDVGTGSPVLVQSPLSPLQLILAGSTSGSLYVVNAGAMGRLCPGSSVNMQKTLVSRNPILTTPLFWPSNNCAYVAPANSTLQSVSLPPALFPACASASQSPETLGPEGSTPVISANGTKNAIVWLIDSGGLANSPIAPAILRAYNPDNLSKEIYNSAAASRDQAGPAVKFTVPTVANGKVYVGTQTELDVYGLK